MSSVGCKSKTPPAARDLAPASLIGEAGAWLRLERDADTIILRPSGPMPRRCTIRPVAIFEHASGFVEANTIMGRLIFANGACEPQTYGPFTKDPKRRLVELFFPVEPMPTDDWPNSPKRWAHCQAIAKRLLGLAGFGWSGFSVNEAEELVKFVHRPEPLDACVLYALAQAYQSRGHCVIEIGSFRGSSGSIFAMALRALRCDAALISIDSHEEQPFNLAQVRLAFQQIGEERRLVQISQRSDQAWRLLRPGSASLIFIDGDHSHEQVLADFRNYRDLIAPGGCLLFHDYGCGDHNGLPDTHPGVRQAVDEHVLPDPHFRPLLLAHTLMAFEKHNG